MDIEVTKLKLDREVPLLVEFGQAMGWQVVREGTDVWVSIPWRSRNQLLTLWLDLNQYPQAAPKGRWVTGPREKTPLPPQSCPQSNSPFLYQPNEHPHPFICLKGFHEYHTHSSHRSDPWDAYRNTITLRRLLASVQSHLDRQ